MNILGLSSNYHDASVALVINGEIRFAAAEERFSRRKHDPSFPIRSARAALKSAGITAEEIDLVVYHEDPHNKLSRSLATSLARWPLSLKSFLLSARDAATSGLRIHFDIARQLGVDSRKVAFAPHHMSHAALAFLTSPFDEAAVVTIDAVGEWVSSGIFSARRTGGALVIEPLHVAPFPHSLGLFYSSITSYLGFRVNDGECSTMALAAFGRPRFIEEMRKIVRISPEGEHELDLSYLDFRSDTQLPVSEKFVALFGPNRDFKKGISFSCFGSPHQEADEENQRFADIAASAQAVLEEAVLAYAKKAARHTGAKNLCYAGGVALNCVANGKLQEAAIFSSVFIPSDPGDGGAALGAALYVSALKESRSQRPKSNPYSGSGLETTELEAILPLLEPQLWPRFAPLCTKGNFRLQWEKFSEAEFLAAVAERLWQGKIVGWVQGPFEQGPRALGARSLLIRADDEALASRLSSQVKKREAFRPYALSLTEREAECSFELGSEGIPHSARWMQASMRVRKEHAPKLRSGLHVDGTSRVQVVDGREIPLFEKLLKVYGQKNEGVEGLVNTSFNESGSPLVASALDALLMFARTDIDVLAVGNLFIEKELGA